MERYKSTRLDNFEYKVLTEINNEKNDFLEKNKNVLLAVSGGEDSMAALYVFNRIKEKLDVSLHVLYVYHDCENSSDEQLEFRLKSYELVRKVSEQLEIPFFSNKSLDCAVEQNPKMKGNPDEAEFRLYRKKYFEKFKSLLSCETLITGHHKNDLFETRVIRLIRGTSLTGVVAMKFFSDEVLRPFLRVEKSEINDYVKRMKVEFLEDPSNQDERFLRNFLRKNWIPRLEEYRPGAAKSFSRSLELIAEDAESQIVDASLGINNTEIITGDIKNGYSILKEEFQRKSSFVQAKLIRRLLELENVTEFSRNHIYEVIKRLQTRQKVFDFVLLNCNWQVNAERITIVKLQQ